LGSTVVFLVTRGAAEPISRAAGSIRVGDVLVEQTTEADAEVASTESPRGRT
jgi:hypothetical protein